MPTTIIDHASRARRKCSRTRWPIRRCLIAAAIITIYIVLGILYESFVHPLTILTGLPAAAVGALGALSFSAWISSVIAIIGILMLIGIVKKNAIMMIDVALVQQREEGAKPFDAIREACLLRFRPIMMTTLAAIIGAVPIAVGSRRQLRTASAARHRGCRRTGRFAAADALHHAGALPLHGPALARSGALLAQAARQGQARTRSARDCSCATAGVPGGCRVKGQDPLRIECSPGFKTEATIIG